MGVSPAGDVVSFNPQFNQARRFTMFKSIQKLAVAGMLFALSVGTALAVGGRRQ